MDFMSDALFDGRSFRLLTIVDCHPREPFAIVPRANFKAFHVVDALDRLATEHSKPRTVRCDTGPEFACRMLDQWAYLNGIEIEFSRPTLVRSITEGALGSSSGAAEFARANQSIGTIKSHKIQ
jgi:putative transposase